MTSIVAIDRNGAIGCRNELPWKLKSDMAFFRATTMNHTVIMGRKTYDSIGGPLKGRKNVILSHNSLLFPSTPECKLALSLDEALALADQNRSREVFVVGGAATYEQLSHLVDRYLVTVVDHVTPDADAFMSQQILDDLSRWDQTEINSVPATPDRDEFAFKIFEADAPDADERAEIRQSMVAKHMMKFHKAGISKARASSAGSLIPQETFAF